LASSRFGFAGSAKISSTLSAGYNMEFELIDSRADMVYNGVGGDDMDGGLNLRQNFWYLEHATLGRISVGRQSTAGDGATEVVLSNSMRNADPNIGSNMWIRGKDGSFVSPLNTTVIETGGYPAHYLQWANDLTADRIASVIRYDSPSIAGFILSASAGADDYADVALRFKREFNSLRVAAAVTYIWDDQVEGLENNVFAGSISAMHTPTGLYAAFSAGNREFDDAILNDQSFWYVQAGIERKWTSCGATTLYGEYGNYSDFLVNVDPISSEATRWGLGINQKIDAAAMDIYAHATFWSFDEDALAPAYGGGFEDLTTVVIGSRIQF
jgi:predicted porin